MHFCTVVKLAKVLTLRLWTGAVLVRQSQDVQATKVPMIRYLLHE